MMGLIFLGLLCSVSTRTTLLHGGPVGIALGKRICETTFGCKSFTYLPLSMKCYIGKSDNINEEKAVTKEIQNTLSTNGVPDNTCVSTSRIILSRSKKPVCCKQKKMRETGPNENKTKPMKLKYHIQNLPFYDAKLKCKEEGGSLVQFKHGFDEDRLKPIFTGGKFDCAWIGLTYYKKMDKFKWDDGTLYLGNDRWYEEEPTHTFLGLTEENCVCMTHSLLLKDFPCSSRSDYICQVPM